MYLSLFEYRVSLWSAKLQNSPSCFFFFLLKPSAVTFKNLTLILFAREIITHSQLLSLEPVNECYIINRSRAAG